MKLSISYDKLLGEETDELRCGAGSLDVVLKEGEGGEEVEKQIQWYLEEEKWKEIPRVWDWGTKISDVTNLVHLTSLSNHGRSYTTSLSNAGSYTLKGVEECYYGTGQGKVGARVCVSVVTLNGKMCLLGHGVEGKEGRVFDNFRRRGRGEEIVKFEKEEKGGLTFLPLMAAIYAVGGAGFYSPAFLDFFENVRQIQENADPKDAMDAINFWIFFAVSHPILQPILFLSEVMHGSPGPRIGGLVPYTFVLLNVLFILVTSKWKEISLSLNIFLFSSAIFYVGAGLKGEGSMADYNLGLNDDYKTEKVRGCPAYEDVRLKSMDNFDLNKYEGLWYEHKFHDYTQFKEVYDTTLDIKLTEGGEGWKDDFGIRGPSPKSSPRSWDKSPVANGAHYFLFGRVDKNDPKGVLRESGFGVEFPNYIVDVQKDSDGNYKEAIQFQCLERGGVRVFEGINFMSRNEVMTDEEMSAMHARAAEAGMEKYGSAPEQMHTVERRLKSQGDVDDGAWQGMWKSLGVDKLLEQLAVLIEDGGR
ncbi:hypothetical protein TrVE_jg5722 [Triparma verrucosa]|uniref:Uncharacterized protein n=1 Tax=Triparma verrucosa TaxID=1606542 RepID=A0A9W6ZA25_9STRA|nr:hypothetical protein TrVE_jg5722 [Triparma verrucosa]